MSRSCIWSLCCALLVLFLLPAGGLEVLEAQTDASYLVRFRELPPAGGDLDAQGRSALPLEAFAEAEIVEGHEHTKSLVVRLDSERMAELKSREDLIVVPADVRLLAVPPSSELAADGPGDSWHMTLVRDLRDTWPVADAELDAVRVAFLDTGVKVDHPDLEGSLVAELAYNAIGDDREGLASVSDGNGHGTSVAGVIVGTYTGVSPGLGLIPVKFADSQGEASLVEFDRGVNYLMGAMEEEGSPLFGRRLVINVSYSTAPGTAESEAIRDYFGGLLEGLKDRPVLFVFAGGNDRVDVGTRYVYPPCLEASNLVSVAASAPDDGLADSFSNYGHGDMEVCAPGEALTTTSTGSEGYSIVYGTSFAAPFVTGVAAWLWASHPEWEAFQVRNVLLNLVLRPYWTEDHHLAPTSYTVPVLSGGAMLFNALDGGQAFLESAAGTTPRALDVRVTPGSQEDLPGSDSDEDQSWVEEVLGGGGCRVCVFPLWLMLPLFLLLGGSQR